MQCEIFGVASITETTNTACENIPQVDHVAGERLAANSTARFIITTNKGAYCCASVVVATGGLSIPAMHPTPFGYELARQFGLAVTPIRASLVPYTFTGALKEMFARLSGNAVPALVRAGTRSFQEALLFTHRGLSGPVVLQVSNYWQPSDPISIDLVPDQSVSSLLLDAKRSHPKSLVRTVLAHSLPKMGRLFNNWEIVPAGTEGYRTAEVTLGGVDTNGLSSKTMQAKQQPGLYFIGEVVDVTGHLGGFNFQWAWSSAYACAQSL